MKQKIKYEASKNNQTLTDWKEKWKEKKKKLEVHIKND